MGVRQISGTSVQVSGIIAVVVAGLLHNAESQQSLLLNSRQVQPQSNTLYGHPHNMSAPPQRANW